MKPIRFMGEQEDPELAVIEARGNTRIYDGTKRSLLDDVRSLLAQVADGSMWTNPPIGIAPISVQAEAQRLIERIDGGER